MNKVDKTYIEYKFKAGDTETGAILNGGAVCSTLNQGVFNKAQNMNSTNATTNMTNGTTNTTTNGTTNTTTNGTTNTTTNGTTNTTTNGTTNTTTNGTTNITNTSIEEEFCTGSGKNCNCTDKKNCEDGVGGISVGVMGVLGMIGIGLLV